MVDLKGSHFGIEMLDKSPVFLVLGTFQIGDDLKQVVISLTQQQINRPDLMLLSAHFQSMTQICLHEE